MHIWYYVCSKVLIMSWVSNNHNAQTYVECRDNQYAYLHRTKGLVETKIFFLFLPRHVSLYALPFSRFLGFQVSRFLFMTYLIVGFHFIYKKISTLKCFLSSPCFQKDSMFKSYKNNIFLLKLLKHIYWIENCVV